MPLPNRPSFSAVRAFFGGPANFSAYVRGGAYVPNIAANAAISTTAAGLRLSQFSGADISAPPSSSVSAGANHSVFDHRYTSEYIGAFGHITFGSNGTVTTGTSAYNGQGSGSWLASGPAGDFEILATVTEGTAANMAGGIGSWLNLGTNRGFYSRTLEGTTNQSYIVGIRFDIRRVGTTTVLASHTGMYSVTLQAGQIE